MSSKSLTTKNDTLPPTSDALDRLFLDCAALETLIAAIRDGIDHLDPGVDSGRVTTEHLMNLAFRIEAAEHGMLAIAHQISDTAISVIERHQRVSALH